MPGLPCLYARDLPLIALMGANTVRTYGLLPEGDRTFLAVLESTNLNWLAGFPLDAYYDPSQTIASQKVRILAAFRAYASRFRGQRRLLGYVFGEEVATGYERKFAGTPSDFYGLIAEAAAILREIEPARTPLIGTAVGDADETAKDVSGLSFWCWNAKSQPSGQGRWRATRPVLISEDNGTATGAEPAEGLLGGVYASFSDSAENGIFRSVPTGRAGLDTLTPRDLYYTLAGRWGGTFPSSWKETGLPRLSDPGGSRSPGTLIRLSGSGLANTIVPYSDESWPYHLAGTCLCIGGAPARLNSLSPRALTAQIPPAVGPGPHPLVFYRAGQASNFSQIIVSDFSTVTLAGPILEARLGHVR